MAKITLPAGTDLAHLYEIDRLALKLMAKHGLTGWTLKWDRAAKRAGQCNYTNCEISLSAPLMSLWPVEHAQNTILHEIAHALTPGHGHDNIWRAKFIAIGGNGKVHWGSDGETQAPLKWEGTCPKGHKFYKARMTARMREGSCSICHPRYYDPRYKLTWRETR